MSISEKEAGEGLIWRCDEFIRFFSELKRRVEGVGLSRIPEDVVRGANSELEDIYGLIDFSTLLSSEGSLCALFDFLDETEHDASPTSRWDEIKAEEQRRA